MACVVQKESVINRDPIGSLKLTRSELNSPTGVAELNCNGSTRMSGRSSTSIFRGEDVHEAILFLQEKHEKILTGLHIQIESLQKKCDDLQFESHLRHVTSNEEEILTKKVKEMAKALGDRDQRIQEYEQKIQEQNKTKEEELQQHRWRELQLTQQVEVGEQRTAELKVEMSRLKTQVHDLQVYCSGIRTGGQQSRASLRQNPTRNVPPSPKVTSPTQNQQLRMSQESLDSFGPKSLGSEDGDVGTFRESRLGGSFVSRMLTRAGSRVQSSPSQSLNLNSSQTFSLPQVTPREPRPSSGIVTLPPISQSQAITRPQVRRQLRLSSAPLSLDSNANIKPK